MNFYKSMLLLLLLLWDYLDGFSIHSHLLFNGQDKVASDNSCHQQLAK